MKRSKKITIGVIIFFVVIAIVVIGRYSVGLYFKKKLKNIFDLKGIHHNKIVMSCGSSVSASSLALAYSIINDDYMAKIYVGSWTEYGKK